MKCVSGREEEEEEEEEERIVRIVCRNGRVTDNGIPLMGGGAVFSFNSLINVIFLFILSFS